MRLSQPDNIVKALVALLLVAAVAMVLITPDPTDDIHAVMRALHASVGVISLGASLLLLVAENLPGSDAPRLTWSNPLQLLCTCRC